MVTTTTEMPDGERLARVETRLESLEQQMVEIRQNIREFRQEMLQEMRDVRVEIRDLQFRTGKQFLWVLGIIITMWISLFVMWGTSMLTVMSRLGG